MLRWALTLGNSGSSCALLQAPACWNACAKEASTVANFGGSSISGFACICARKSSLKILLSGPKHRWHCSNSTHWPTIMRGRPCMMKHKAGTAISTGSIGALLESNHAH